MTRVGVPSYTYAATVARHVDGDTIDLTVDLGFSTSVRERFRLYGVDTPERGEPSHDEATAALVALAPVGAVLTIRVFKTREKYGRYLALLETADGVAVNSELVRRGLAVGYYGGKKGAST